MVKKYVNILTIFILFSTASYESPVFDSLSFASKYDSAKYFSNMNDYKPSVKLFNQLIVQYDSSSQYQLARIPIIYNQLGIIDRNLGEYTNAVRNYFKAIEFTSDTSLISVIYVNLGNVYSQRGELNKALSYYTTALSYCVVSDKYDITEFIFYNIGYTYLITKEWRKSIPYTQQSLRLNLASHSTQIGYSYLNLAIAYQNLNMPDSAEWCFQKSIREFKRYYGPLHYKTAQGYMDYADFLREKGLYKKSRALLDNAYHIFRNTFGERHYNTSNCLIKLGLLSGALKNYTEALKFYQKALIAKVGSFNDTDIYSIPKTNSIPDLDLIDIYNDKAIAFEKLANQKDFVKNLEASLQCINQNADIIEKLRRGYLSESSKLQLTGNESNVYSSGLRVAVKLYEKTGKEKYLETALKFSERSKYGVLRELRCDMSARSAAGIPDSLAEKERMLARQIDEKRIFIEQEYRSEQPAKEVIEKARMKVFNLMREQENLVKLFESRYPTYYHIKYSMPVINSREIKHYLNRGQAMVEYSVADSTVYIFAFTCDTFYLKKICFDKSFVKGLDFYKTYLKQDYSLDYKTWRETSYMLYRHLIAPVENTVGKKELIIIPDSRLSQVSFESFTTQPYKENKWHAYQQEPYLLYNNAISYSLSASILLENTKNEKKLKRRFIGFAPGYENSPDSLQSSPGAIKSIHSIARLFFGRTYSGNEATEDKLGQLSKGYKIIHFYAHGQEDTLNPELSKMILSRGKGLKNDGYLYAYEISNMKIETDLVTLISCNSGAGSISEGEGVLSIGRSFFNAGAPAMVYSLWAAYSDVSYILMKDFYKNLLKGDDKAEALRKAKIHYISVSHTVDANPRLWSSLVVVGDPSPIFKNYLLKVILTGIGIILSLLLLIAGIRKLIKYF